MNAIQFFQDFYFWCVLVPIAKQRQYIYNTPITQTRLQKYFTIGICKHLPIKRKCQYVKFHNSSLIKLLHFNSAVYFCVTRKLYFSTQMMKPMKMQHVARLSDDPNISDTFSVRRFVCLSRVLHKTLQNAQTITAERKKIYMIASLPTFVVPGDSVCPL